MVNQCLDIMNELFDLIFKLLKTCLLRLSALFGFSVCLSVAVKFPNSEVFQLRSVSTAVVCMMNSDWLDSDNRKKAQDYAEQEGNVLQDVQIYTMEASQEPCGSS